MRNQCVKCRYLNPAGARYCNQCATRLDFDSELKTDELKLVSILFADIKGFSKLTELLQPDQLKEVILEKFNTLSTLIRSENGMVLKFGGDSILAVFGLNSEDSDFPMHAAYAALKMKRMLEQDRGITIQNRVHDFAMRIGLHFGQVVTGLIDGQPDIIGNAVNVAKRLEERAPVGKILISQSQARMLGSNFQVDPFDSFVPMGTSSIVNSFLLVKRRYQEQASSAGVIGRDEELNQMVAYASEKITTGSVGLIQITGNPGMGKTHLLKGLKKILFQSFPQCLHTDTSFNAAARGGNRLCVNVLNRLLRPKEEVPLEENLKKFGFAPSGPKELNAVRFFLGIPSDLDPENMEESLIKERKYLWERFTERFFQTISRSTPLLIMAENFQHSDEDSIRFVQNLLTSNQGCILFIILCRDEKILEKLEFHDKFHCNLTPWTQDQCKIFIESQTRGPVSNDLSRRLFKLSDGNPLLASELLKIFQENSTFELLLENSPAMELSLRTNLDGLSEQQHQALKILAALPEGGKVKMVKNICGKENFSGLSSIIEILDDHTGDAGRIYKYRNELMRETVYRSLTTRQKVGFHQKIYRWYRNNAIQLSERWSREEYLAVLYHHLTSSGDYRKAFRWGSELLRLKIAGYQNMEAFAIAEKLLGIGVDLEPLPTKKNMLQVIRWLALTGNRIGQAQVSLLRIRSLKGMFSFNRIQKFQLTLLEMECCQAASDLLAWEHCIQECEKFLQAVTTTRIDKSDLVKYYILRGNYCRLKSTYVEARNWFEQAIRAGRSLDDPGILATTLSAMGSILMNLREYQGAAEYYQSALVIQSKLDRSLDLSITYSNFGCCLTKLRNFDQAEKVLEQGLTLKETCGDRIGYAGILTNLGNLFLEQGKEKKAMKVLEQALEIEEKCLDYRRICVTLQTLGNLRFGQQEFEIAQKNFKRALAIAEKRGLKTLIPGLCNNLGLCSFRLNAFESAGEHFRRAIDLSSESGDIEVFANSHLNLGNLRQIEGKMEDSQESYAEALNNYTKLGNLLDIAVCELNLGLVLDGKGDTEAALRRFVRAIRLLLQCGDKSILQNAMCNLSRTNAFSSELFQDLFTLYEQNPDEQILNRIIAQLDSDLCTHR